MERTPDCISMSDFEKLAAAVSRGQGDPAKLRAMERHLLSCDYCREHWTAEELFTPNMPGNCLTPDEFGELARDVDQGEKVPQELADAEEHVLHCRRCADLWAIDRALEKNSGVIGIHLETLRIIEEKKKRLEGDEKTD